MLTEFLLARIAEDKERAEFVARQIEGSNWQPHEPWMLSWHDEYDLLCIEPLRALAECESKRAIVEWHAETEDCCEERWGPMQWATDENISAGTDALGNLSIRRDIGGEEWLGCVTLAHLATVYTDHPDYREEWRP